MTIILNEGEIVHEEDKSAPEVARGVGRPLSSKYSLELGFSFNLYLGQNLERLRNAVLYQDFDLAVLIDGKEGSGKSVFAMQIAYFLDRDHSLDLETQVIFTPEQFKKAVNSLGPGKAIVWDEARAGLNRRRSTQQVNLDITDMLAECRQNNLFMVIVMPSFYDMDRNVAVHRSRLLIHCSYDFGGPDNRPLRRGFFRLYNEDGKQRLFENRELRYRYPYLPNMCFDGNFPHHYLVDQEVYRRKKREAVSRYTKIEQGVHGEVIGKLLVKLRDADLLVSPYGDRLAKLFNVTERTVMRWMEVANEEAKEES